MEPLSKQSTQPANLTPPPTSPAAPPANITHVGQNTLKTADTVKKMTNGGERLAGKIGTVRSSTINTPSSIAGKERVFDAIPTHDVDKVLADKPTGSFLLRPSNSNPNQLVISQKTNKGIFHYKLDLTEDGKYKAGKFSLKIEDWFEKIGGEKNLILPPQKEDILKSAQGKCKRAFERLTTLLEGTSKGAKPMAPLYWAELIHPEHPYGAQLSFFFTAWKKSSSTDSFIDWMEKLERGEAVPGKEKIRPDFLKGGRPSVSKLEYLDADQRKDYELKVDEISGKISTAIEGSEFSTQTTPHIFIVSTNNNIYVGKYDRGTFNHSSFLSGKPVLSAGELLVREGKVIGITDKSGHYKSDIKMVVRGILALKEAGVDLSGTKVILNAHPLSKKPKEIYYALKFLEQHKNLL